MESLDICIATYRLFDGNGIDVSVMQFARELRKRHNVTIMAVAADAGAKDIGVLLRPANNPLKMRSVAAEIDRLKFDLVSTHYTPFDLVATMSKTPHFLHDPGVPPLSAMRKISDLYLWSLVNTARLISARKARSVLPISQYLSDEFRKKYLYRGRTEILPYCIEFPEHLPAPAVLPFDKYVLYVGRHTPYKGVHELIDIFTEARKELGSDVHLVTIGLGEPDYLALLEQKAKAAGNVHILGFVTDVWPYYAGASVYATCSRWEGQDRPVIEAQYAGKPVVSFDNCSHPETVTGGTLAKDRVEFKKALIKYLTSESHLNVSARVAERYSPAKMAEEFVKIVNGVANLDRA